MFIALARRKRMHDIMYSVNAVIRLVETKHAYDGAENTEMGRLLLKGVLMQPVVKEICIAKIILYTI